jgi:predicted small metal-binding protein
MVAGKALRCECGYELRAQAERERVAEIRRHALEAHGIAFSGEDALAVLLRSELELLAERPRKATKEGRG